MTRASGGALTFAPTAAMRPSRTTTVPRSITGPETVTMRAPVRAYALTPAPPPSVEAWLPAPPRPARPKARPARGTRPRAPRRRVRGKVFYESVAWDELPERDREKP